MPVGCLAALEALSISPPLVVQPLAVIFLRFLLKCLQYLSFKISPLFMNTSFWRLLNTSAIIFLNHGFFGGRNAGQKSDRALVLRTKPRLRRVLALRASITRPGLASNPWQCRQNSCSKPTKTSAGFGASPCAARMPLGAGPSTPSRHWRRALEGAALTAAAPRGLELVRRAAPKPGGFDVSGLNGFPH